MKFETVWPGGSAEKCTEHVNCFKQFDRPDRMGGLGWWKPLTPIDILPGHKLYTVDAIQMARGYTGWIAEFVCELQIMVDGGVHWKAPSFKWKQDDWERTHIEIPAEYQDISGFSKLEFWFHQSVSTWPWASTELHSKDITISGEWISEERPELCEVNIRVLNRVGMTPIRGAYVALMMGDRVIADGRTNGEGKVAFVNIEEGDYTVYVYKDGFHEAKETIEVRPPKVMRDILLSPVPGPAIPWEWIIGGIAVVVVGGVIVAYARRRGASPPVVVVKE